jgi:hypothetical protein
MEIYYSTYVRG